MFVSSGQELKAICESRNIKIWQYTVESEMKRGYDEKTIFEQMKKNLEIMKISSNHGMENEVISVSGLIGGDAVKISDYSKSGLSLCGDFITKAMARALSCSEVNAAMGKIVAAPTAGSCGILPAAIISAGEKLNKSDESLVQALFTASGVGILIAQNASISGAEGGCQAECGSAAAMAAAAVVEMMGGSVGMALDAASIVIKNVLGLVCDPIAGLVEIPCAKRNIAGTVLSLTTADLVMSGVKSKIPFDDAVSAMNKVGKEMSCSLKETAMGGLAATPTGECLKKSALKLHKNSRI
ncbi:L-serine ammonia-lyase, iron-sulfur-dependent, subunit alpha [Clostridium oryzae]|uniref:L-serine dehydratase n=1 Tax=Clostridium oryzae TaxID=1450648 RepID=A0A1V4IE34_9CLOT|nr:L-serine ammonia-lyase, iron-sulfur-dependent, subunit alpha [Clostridium oryzae]OPJ58268.1 L-serine dehydratase, alpha chain [Clostridium oryzae]